MRNLSASNSPEYLWLLGPLPMLCRRSVRHWCGKAVVDDRRRDLIPLLRLAFGLYLQRRELDKGGESWRRGDARCGAPTRRAQESRCSDAPWRLACAASGRGPGALPTALNQGQAQPRGRLFLPQASRQSAQTTAAAVPSAVTTIASIALICPPATTRVFMR